MNKSIIALLFCSLFLVACVSPTEKPNGEMPLAVFKALEDLESRMAVDMTDMMSLECQEAQWPDSCLGLGGGGDMCAQVITPGYEVTITVAASEYTYRTDEEGEIVRLVPIEEDADE